MAGWCDPGEPIRDASRSVESGSARFRVSAPGSWSPNAGRRQIWQGRLAEHDLAAVIAAPYAGKSVLAPHVAWGISQGAEVFGRPTVATRSAWFAVEDAHGAADRVEALRLARGEAPGFRLITQGENGFSLLRDDDVDALADLVAREGIGVLVIDTLSAAAPGHRENDVEAVSTTIARLRRITRAGCTVIVTHHLAKGGDNENPTARGSGDLQAAFDVVIALNKNRDSDEVLARIVKNRNGPPETFGFRLGVVDLGACDRWGEPLRAPVLAEELTATEARGAKPMTAAAAAVLRVLEALGGEVPVARLIDDAAAPGVVSFSEKRDSRRKAVRRALDDLQTRGRLEIRADGTARRTDASGDPWCEEE